MRFFFAIAVCCFVTGCVSQGPVEFADGDELLEAASYIQLGDTRNEVVYYLGWRKDSSSAEVSCRPNKDGGGLNHPRFHSWHWNVYPVSLNVDFTDDSQVYRIRYSDDRAPSGAHIMLGPDYSKHTEEYIAQNCSPFKKERREPAVFDSWDLAVEHLQWRQGIESGEKQKEQIKKDSIIEDVDVGGIDFRIVYFDWRRESKFGLRGSNGINYVFQKDAEKYKLVGGFHGSGIRIVENDNPIMLLSYYHVGGAGGEPMRYPFVDGIFNYMDPEFKSDLTK